MGETLKILFLSDTHQNKIKNLPKADLLIHTGDWSGRGTYQDTLTFLNWMEEIKNNYAKIICVPGNHDIWVHDFQSLAKQEFEARGLSLLIDESFEYYGVKVYGMPWTPIFGRWGFMGDDEFRKRKCENIPDDISILASHGPPLGYLDQLAEFSSDPGKNVGCEHLLRAVMRIQPEIHAFGHIHEGSGIQMLGKTMLVNASHMDEYYKSTNGFKLITLD